MEKSDVAFRVMSPGPAPLVIFLGGVGVRMHERPPPRHLAPFVSHIWHLTADRETTLHVIPDGCTDIIEGDVVGSLTGGLIAATSMPARAPTASGSGPAGSPRSTASRPRSWWTCDSRSPMSSAVR